MINPSHPSSEMHLGKFPEQRFSRKSRIPHARCSGPRRLQQPNRWMTSSLQKSLIGKDVPDHEEFDLMMASTLKRCYDKQTHLRKKISVEEQRAQKDNRFLRRRQIAHLIMNTFRPTGSYDEIPGLSGLFSIKLENDDIQDFDLRWEQALLLTSDPPSDTVLEGLYVSQVARFLASSDNCGTFQSRKPSMTTRLSQTKNGCEIAY